MEILYGVRSIQGRELRFRDKVWDFLGGIGCIEKFFGIF